MHREPMQITAKQLTVLKGTERLAEARRFMGGILEHSPFSPTDRRLVALAASEALERIVEHARDDGRAKDEAIEMSVDLNDTRIEIVISDQRNDFYREPVHPEQALKSELGLFLIRQIMDEVRYTYRRGFENALVMVKFTP